MTDEKYLIVSADDFGQSPGINRGIIEAHERGIVTSTSLMTRWPAAGEAAIYAREHPKLSIGLHLDLGEWVCREGKWTQLYSVIPWTDKSAVEAGSFSTIRCLSEVNGRASHSCQLSSTHPYARAGSLCYSPDLSESWNSAKRLVPEIHYFTKFYGQTPEGLPIPSYISLDRMIEIISTLPTGLTVITCHPGYADDLKQCTRQSVGTNYGFYVTLGFGPLLTSLE